MNFALFSLRQPFQFKTLPNRWRFLSNRNFVGSEHYWTSVGKNWKKTFEFRAFFELRQPSWMLSSVKFFKIDRTFFYEDFDAYTAYNGCNLAEIWPFLYWWRPSWMEAPSTTFGQLLYFSLIENESRNPKHLYLLKSMQKWIL